MMSEEDGSEGNAMGKLMRMTTGMKMILMATVVVFNVSQAMMVLMAMALKFRCCWLIVDWVISLKIIALVP